MVVFDEAFCAMDWSQAQSWTFEPADRATFRALDLAEAAGRAGGTAPAVLNAANEVAVDAFLDGTIGFLDIAATVEAVLEDRPDSGTVRDVADVLDADAWARDRAARILTTRSQT